jgi:hypothetical protein
MKKLFYSALCTLASSLYVNGMEVTCTYIQHKPQNKHIKHDFNEQPYRYDELCTIISHMTTVCTGLGIMATGYFLQQPFVTATGLALFIGGSDDWKQYDKYGRYNILKKTKKKIIPKDLI